MANAYKCDICGDLFEVDPDGVNTSTHTQVMTISDPSVVVNATYADKFTFHVYATKHPYRAKPDENDNPVDVCPNCFKKALGKDDCKECFREGVF